jgi:hypothetical protein
MLFLDVIGGHPGAPTGVYVRDVRPCIHGVLFWVHRALPRGRGHSGLVPCYHAAAYPVVNGGVMTRVRDKPSGFVGLLQVQQALATLFRVTNACRSLGA